MKKSLIYLAAIVSLLLTSCANDDTNHHEEQSNGITSEEISNGLKGGMKAFRVDFTKPIIFEYTTAVEKDSIIDSIVKDLYEVELKSHLDENNQLILDELAVNILINDFDKTITLQPEPITQVLIYSSSPGDTDDEKCGGQEGDGWKSYGKCYDESCVSSKSAEAADDLSYQLGNNKCLDVRVKRNALYARICARVISC
ncbi:MAG: hypothetical protein BM557_02315 [Flavobacterium sp. MedPE-SWcel]|uniref:hypothetical protein n=1 Tax=uncultured Flavobacterium sp. TaxID=165435 RepID=UPI00091D44C4|nr:hypothetical protein [uncultured Flavobacterium sp.]OIQ21651.1 MAG: hypothetical protein BM557_02315 [Flavobacterium sp. MedPE-SWcel]